MGLGLLSVILTLAACSQASSSTAAITSTSSTTNVMTSATPATSQTALTTTNVTTSKPPTTASDLPQYGGTLTIFPYQGQNNMGQNFAALQGGSAATQAIMPWIAMLLTGDIDKYGPRGNNAFTFQLNQFVPNDFMKGDVAQSWELTATQLIFHIRQGVMWTGNHNIGMAAREFTANDAVISWNYILGVRQPLGGFPYIAGVSAPDKYTFVMDLKYYNSELLRQVGFALMYCPETIKADPTNWKNQVGTGPFILSDYVQNSQVTFVANTSYYGKTTINGKQYSLPFVSKLLLTAIPDISTQIAALRVGKIDMHMQVPLTYQSTLTSTSPDIKQIQYERGDSNKITMQLGPGSKFRDVNVRKALMIGTDMQAITKAVYLNADIVTYPYNGALPDSIHAKLSDLPAADQALYTYDPVKAQQMLATAGFPNGFPMTLSYRGDDLDMQNQAALLQAQWAKFGVVLTLQPMDNAVLGGILGAVNGSTLKDASIINWGNTSPTQAINRVTPRGTNQNFTNLNDTYLNKAINDVQLISDNTQWNKMIKDIGVYMLDNVTEIGLPTPYVTVDYWPWVKNYYNEFDAGQYDAKDIWAEIWLSQTLKKQMGH
jgi:peptide/nickel transport system substrate-binding protein